MKDLKINKKEIDCMRGRETTRVTPSTDHKNTDNQTNQSWHRRDLSTVMYLSNDERSNVAGFPVADME